ncbi:MAG: hypothetical protein MUO82_00420 [Candidatus Thermoplasmatota archaeon]|nr:hypothetical protein [Candidatus Thermoplasmatota archaeon]
MNNSEIATKYLKSGLLTNTTCWILGAGASYDCGGGDSFAIPLTNDLVIDKDNLTQKVIELVDTGKLRLNADELAGISNFRSLPSPHVIEGIRYLMAQGLLKSESIKQALGSNLEITLQMIRDLTIHKNPSIANIAVECFQDIVRCIATTISWAQMQSLSFMDQTGRVSLSYQANNYIWLSTMACHFPNWSILTLNYDELLDLGFRILLRMNPPPVQYIAWKSICDNFIYANSNHLKIEFDHGVYLKLHGTLDIYECRNPDCGTSRRLYRSNSDDAIISVWLQDKRPPCPDCGMEGGEFIVPPGRNKSLNERAFDSIVVEHAYTALRQADQLILIGYSFPEYDFDIVELLKRALIGKDNIKIDVITPDAYDIANRLSMAIRQPVNPIKESFSEFGGRMWREIRIKPPPDGIHLR